MRHSCLKHPTSEIDACKQDGKLPAFPLIPCPVPRRDTLRGDITYPPPSPHFWPEGIFQGRGVGVYILRPPAARMLYATPFLYTPNP